MANAKANKEEKTMGKKGRAAKYNLESRGAVTRLLDFEGNKVTTIEGYQNARKLDGYAEVWRNGVRAANAKTPEAKEAYLAKQATAQKLVDFCNARIKKIKGENAKTAAKTAVTEQAPVEAQS